MKNLTIRIISLSLVIGCLVACGSPSAEETDLPGVEQDELPAKAPEERAEALDERQTEWSQSTYAERPPSDSLAAEITDTSNIKNE